MPNESAELATAFAKYVLSSGKRVELQTLIKNLDDSAEESHNVVKEINALYCSASTSSENRNEICNGKDDIARHDEISKFLASGPPRLLLPDMEHLYEIDLDVEVNKAKTIDSLEKIKNGTFTLPPSPGENDFNLNTSDIKDYTDSLEMYQKRLAYISTIECNKEFQRNPVLEHKLQSLCDDVELFWKMVQAKMKISQSNDKTLQKITVEDGAALSHVETIKKLIGIINEVTFLIQNKN